MKRSRLIAVAGVAVVGCVVWRARRPRRASITPVIPWLVYAAVSTTPRQDVDLSFGWVLDTIGSFFGGLVLTVIGDIVSAIAHALSLVGATIINWVTALWHGIQDTFGAVLNVVSFVQAQAQQLFGIAIGAVNSAYTELRGLIDGVIGNVENITGGILDNIWNLVWSVLTPAIAIGGGLWQWVWNTFIVPLYEALSRLYGDVLNAVGGLFTSLLDEITGAGGWLYEWAKSLIIEVAGPLINSVLGPYIELFDVIRGALPFLKWVAAHTLDWFQSLADSIEALTPQHVLGAIENAINDNTDDVDAILNRFFG